MSKGGDCLDTNTSDQRVSTSNQGGFFAAMFFGWLAVILPCTVCSSFGVRVRVRLPVPLLTAEDESIASAWYLSWYCVSGLGADECGCFSQRVLPLRAFAYL